MIEDWSAYEELYVEAEEMDQYKLDDMESDDD